MEKSSKSRKKRRFLTPLCIFLALLVILAVATAVVFSLPLRSLGLSDKVVLNDKTVADMRLEEENFSRLLPIVRSLCKDNSRLVNYAPSSSDVTSTAAKFAPSTANILGHIQYSSLIYKSATFFNGKALTFTDRALAVLLRETVKQAPDDLLLSTSAEVMDYLGERALKEILDYLEAFDVTVEQVKLTSKRSLPLFELLLSIDISQFVEGVELPIFGALYDRVYVNLSYRLDVDSLGNLLLTDGTLSLNGKNADTSKKVLDGLLIALSDNEYLTSQAVLDGIASFVQVVFEHVGVIGSNLQNKGMSGVDITNATMTFVPQSLI